MTSIFYKMVLNWWLFFSFVTLAATIGVSYNQPKFCSNVSWNSSGTNFENISAAGSGPYGNGYILVWHSGNMYPSTVIFGLNIPLATYATLNGDIYCDNGYVAKQVNKYTVDSNITTNAMNIGRQCVGLFTDLNNTLYCAMFDRHIM
ncbi:hypothetical protein I4U23_016001 [Adineta vaga]|nr:hypothetical protein I4U23_016001 [Adineta vaga]